MNKIVTGLMSEAAIQVGYKAPRQEATPFSQSTTELDTKKLMKVTNLKWKIRLCRAHLTKLLSACPDDQLWAVRLAEDTAKTQGLAAF